MKANIVTVFQSPNYGSFLQAWALNKIISQKYDVYMIDAGIRNPWKNAYLPGIKRCLSGIIKRNPSYIRYNAARISCTMKAYRSVKILKLNKAEGAFIFGSDEIWNLSRAEMRNYPVLWGEGIAEKNKMSYAPSLNGCHEALIDQGSFLKEIAQFVGVSVRDEYSKKILEEKTGREVAKVVDPTMLLDKSYYESHADNIKIAKGYIAVYLFDADAEMIERIKQVARQLDKRLVSVGVWAPWCDECVVDVNPFLYYINADFVITNTFHGTAFAINLQKRFAALSQGKSKIIELLGDYGLSSRDVTGLDASDIADRLNEAIDYDSVSSILNKNREKSLEYLFSSLERMESNQ